MSDKPADVGRVEGDWTVEFEELWDSSFTRDGDKNTFEFEKLKSYIQSLLNTRMDQHDKDVRRQAMEEVLEKLPKEKKTYPDEDKVNHFYIKHDPRDDREWHTGCAGCESECFNDCLSRVKEVLAIINTSSSAGESK